MTLRGGQTNEEAVCHERRLTNQPLIYEFIFTTSKLYSVIMTKYQTLFIYLQTFSRRWCSKMEHVLKKRKKQLIFIVDLWLMAGRQTGNNIFVPCMYLNVILKICLHQQVNQHLRHSVQNTKWIKTILTKAGFTIELFYVMAVDYTALSNLTVTT